jgi:hypothetical protein
MGWPASSFRTLLPPAVRQNQDQLDADVQGYLSEQHNSDGTHGDITATSLALTSAQPSGAQTTVGTFTDIAWSPALYSGAGGMTWTPTSANQVTWCYELVGHKMTVIFWLQNSTIVAPRNAILLLALPLGMYATRVTDGFGWGIDASTIPSSTIITVPTVSTTGTLGKFMTIKRLDGATWMNGVAPYITGQLTYPV